MTQAAVSLTCRRYFGAKQSSNNAAIPSSNVPYKSKPDSNATPSGSITPTLALALTVAVAVKIVGVLLIGALLIIPAAAARPFAVTPERMAVLATALAMASVLIGLSAAWQFDLRAGPVIVCAAAGLFALSAINRQLRPQG